MGAAAAARRAEAAKDPNYPDILRAVEAKVRKNGESLNLDKITLGVAEGVRDQIRVILYGKELELDVSGMNGGLKIDNIATIKYGNDGLKFGFRNQNSSTEMPLGADVVNVDGREVQIKDLQNFVREVVQALLVEFAVAGLKLEGSPQQELQALVERVTRPDERASYDRHSSGLILA